MIYVHKQMNIFRVGDMSEEYRPICSSSTIELTFISTADFHEKLNPIVTSFLSDYPDRRICGLE